MILKYANIKEGIFVSRPNRFIAVVNIDGKDEICHVKNTGRLKELLQPGCTVYLCVSDNTKRKTKYDLVSVIKNDKIINIDSQAPNKVFREWAVNSGYFPGIIKLKAETVYKNSRFDFYIETENEKAYIEVKGVTLENNGVALFPDAPTERGVKHIYELCDCVDNGFNAYVVFVIQMKGITHFEPNRKTHPEFAKALCFAKNKGVKILCIDSIATHNTLKLSELVEYKIEGGADIE